MQLRIGLDLDNTLICYDRAFLHAAKQHAYVAPDFSGDKRAVRDAIRAATLDGDARWQRLQGHVYGPGIHDAELFPGVVDFLRAAKAAGHALSISSHKTEFGHFDATRTPLRRAALEFLEEHGVLSLIPTAQVAFSSELAGKLGAIAAAECTHFIDDLEDVLDHPDFPAAVHGLWFAPNLQTRALHPGRAESDILRSWNAAAIRFELSGAHA